MNTSNRYRFMAICPVIMLGLSLPALAWAQDKAKRPDPSDLVGALEGGPKHRPWARGVSLDRQKKARVMFHKANELLANQYFKQAAAKYRQVLEVWDHPAVYYNLSLALMNLDQPVELYQSLRQALRHGVPPLVNDANHQRARKYLNLLEKQLAHVEVVCEEDGAQVTMDGKPLFTSPGRKKLAVLAGGHTIAASKEGFISDNKQAVLSPGKHETIELKLFTLADFTEERRRFPTWMPWLVTGSGVLLASGGGALHNSSRAGFLDYDRNFDAQCMPGCVDKEVPELSGQLGSATWRQRFAYSMYIAGGAALATGLVLVFLNRPETIRREIPGVEAPAGLMVAPMVAPGTTGIHVSLDF